MGYQRLLVCWSSFVPWCCSRECRQVLSYSSSSQISGTCGSQGVVSAVISIWVLTVFIFFCLIWWVSFDIIRCVVVILPVVCLLLTALVYIRIYFAVQRLRKNEIHVLQVPQLTENNEITNLANIVKSAFGIFYVFLLFIFCSLPPFICIAVFQINGPSIPLQKVFLFSWTSLFLNSSLNPVIYCWKMRHIRHVVMDILRNMVCLRNDASH